jgi:periplasmic copper chaperone A
MSRTSRGVVVSAIGIAALCSALLAAQDRGVKTSNGWVKLPASGETQALAFVTIENPGMYEVNVTSATADAAGKVEMRDAGQAVTFINVPAYGRLDMSPGGVHLVLLDVKHALKEGDTVTLTLATDSDMMLTVAAQVRTK